MGERGRLWASLLLVAIAGASLQCWFLGSGNLDSGRFGAEAAAVFELGGAPGGDPTSANSAHEAGAEHLVHRANASAFRRFGWSQLLGVIVAFALYRGRRRSASLTAPENNLAVWFLALFAATTASAALACTMDPGNGGSTLGSLLESRHQWRFHQVLWIAADIAKVVVLAALVRLLLQHRGRFPEPALALAGGVEVPRLDEFEAPSRSVLRRTNSPPVRNMGPASVARRPANARPAAEALVEEPVLAVAQEPSVVARPAEEPGKDYVAASALEAPAQRPARSRPVVEHVLEPLHNLFTRSLPRRNGGSAGGSGRRTERLPAAAAENASRSDPRSVGRGVERSGVPGARPVPIPPHRSGDPRLDVQETPPVSSDSLVGTVLSAPIPAPWPVNVPDMESYRELYAESVTEPEAFWARQAERLDWNRPFDRVYSGDFAKAQVRWFEGGELNVSVNCIDRHVDAGYGNQVAILWEGDDPADDRRITYRELKREVCRFANVLRGLGVKKGDRVCLYLPMIPELAIAMLACSRIGAVHSIVFAGFSANSLRDRILDSSCKLLVTADEGVRGGRRIPLKAIADEALKECPCVEHELLVRRTGRWVPEGDGREVWYEELVRDVADECEPASMDAEDPLFLLYTSGSTGKPKGVLHTTGGYLVYAALTHQLVFDSRPGDVYWCTADIGWITGHSYIVYGPLCNRATTLMFEGVPSFPDHGRFWDVVDKHQVNVFYTAPTAIRAIAQHGDEPVRARSRASLRLLGTVGEPINPEVWRWYHDVVGDGRCPIVDTWWQTETGGILITPLPHATKLVPGSATLPFFGIRPVLLDDEGHELKGNGVSGNLCIKAPWPGMMRTVYGDHDRFFQTYFQRFPGYYFTGDGCRRDEEGNYWITGRVDDVLNVSGHRLGTAEVESALVSHDAVAEAAVVGYPHEIKGTGIHAYVLLNDDAEPSAALEKALVAHVRTEIGPIATPDRIQFCPGLPKTRSGKIMRRILRKIAAGETDRLGDVSTLADPTVVEKLARSARSIESAAS